MSAPRAGDLIHSVSLQSRASSTGSYGTDANDPDWTTVTTQRCAIRWLGGSERFEQADNSGVFAEIDGVFTFRYSTSMAAASPKHSLLLGSRRFDIKAPINVDQRNRTIEIEAKEKEPSGV